MPKHLLYISVISGLLISCAQSPEKMVGPTIGSIDIVADQSIRYIVEQEENIFERTYKHANINISYLPEFDIFKLFMADSIKVIMTTRQLTEEEMNYFDQRQSHPVQTVFATGALAFLVSKTSADTTYTYEEMISMFNNKEEGKLFVIENAKSGITHEVLDLIDTTGLPSHFYALDSKDKVIDYVLAHENAIGIVDLSDISDTDSPLAKEMLTEIELVGITRPVDSIQYGFVKPYQYNLQDNKYPFLRNLYIISRTGRSDVSSGFASFVAGEIGQKIILKSGLLPIYQSERILEIRNISDIKVVK